MYIIGGPTASGKSSLAFLIANKFNGEIINADSLQLYKNIPILSAVPSRDELNQVNHHLFCIYDDNQKSTVHNWLNLAKQEISNIFAKGKIPIVVGGTGLYINALLYGLSEIPEISKSTKDYVLALQIKMDSMDFYNMVINHDPLVKESLHPNDRQRLSRALEVFLETGKSIRYFQNNLDSHLKTKYKYFVITPEREKLYRLINERTIQILDSGAIEEVKKLKNKNIHLNAPVCKAIGVKEIWHYLDGVITKDEMLNLMQQSTRQYAKRQYTWFKNQSKDAVVISNPSAIDIKNI